MVLLRSKICLALFIFLLVFLHAFPALATDVGGNITENTTWTAAASPYVVTSTVQVFEGVRLTIEPGVTVKFNSKKGLTIGGELYAVGTPGNLITFTYNTGDSSDTKWDKIKFINSSVDASVDINHNYIYGSIISYCIVENGGGIDIDRSSPYISLNIIRNNRPYGGIHIEDGSSVISNNIIKNNVTTYGAGIYLSGNHKPYIAYNDIVDNDAGFIGKGGGIYISSSSSGGAVIINNRITGNEANYGSAIYVDGGYIDILNNDIYDNGANNSSYVSHDIICVSSGYGVTISYNNILSNGYSYTLYNRYNNITATQNWWGTTVASEIDSLICDKLDYLEYGLVTYEPIATEPYQLSGGIISGTVTDASTSSPIAGATVSCAGGSATSDAAGAYTISNAQPQDYTLTVAAKLYHSTTIEDVTVTAGETTTQDASLVPKTIGNVSGKAINASDLTVLSSVKVKLSNATEAYTATTNASGEFAFTDITHGDYQVSIASAGYWSITQTVTINIDETTQVDILGIPQSLVDAIQAGMYTQAQLDQAVADAEAAKDAIIAGMFSQTQLDQAVLNEMLKYDPDGDGLIGLENVLYYLQVFSGFTRDQD